MAVGEMQDRAERPAYVRFKRVAVEDKAASLEQRKYVAKDVDYALITPPYSKDCVEIKVTQWKLNVDQDVRAGRIPKEWADNWLKGYEAWLNGQELPVNGTPIKGWGVISPAQQEMLIRINILTVEDLDGVNDEGLRRIGMGALDLKNKARAWLAQMQDKGPLTIEVAALKSENALLKSTVEQMHARLTQIESSQKPPVQLTVVEESTSITADDILPENEPPKRNRR